MLDWIFSAYVSAQRPEEIISDIPESVVLEEAFEQKKDDTFSFVKLSDQNYSDFRKSIDEYLPEGSFCALFVNRMLTLRYDIPVYGDAWTMQLHPKNKEWLDLLWAVPEEEFDRSNRLSLHKKEDRIKHYYDLYRVLDAQKDPQGVIGMVYYFSFYREKVAAMLPKQTLAQTHVGYVGGRKQFSFTNPSQETKTLEEVLGEQYGEIHEYERAFVASRVRLDTLLDPGDEYFYTDYLFEENYRGVRHGSLLEVFLRKHRNNRITPLLRPNSYSQISDALRGAVGAWN